MRRRGFESLLVLSVFDNSAHLERAHDVAVACRLAMAEVWVQLPLGAFVEQDVGKPGTPRASGARDRRFKSGRPDFDCGGACVGTGRRLLSVTSQVRFLPPQLCVTEGQANWRWQPPRKRPSDEPWGFDSLTFRLTRPWPIGTRHQPSKLNRRVQFPQGALECDWGSASGRPSGFGPEDGGSTPPPRAFSRRAVSRWKRDAESSNGKMRRSERLHVGSIPASAA